MNQIASCTRRALLGVIAAAAMLPAFAAPAATNLPGDSIYRLNVPLTDQNGKPLRLADLRGEPVLISMFYSSCQMVCPMIFETIHTTLKKSGGPESQHMKVVMISFDPARDTVPVLKKTAELRKADERWTLARTDDAGARQIAAVLGVQYRKLASGEFNHSSAITLLDRDGRIVASSSVLGSADPKLVQAMQQQASATR